MVWQEWTMSKLASVERRILDAGPDQLGARQTGAGIGIALVGLDGGHVAHWARHRERRVAKLPRLEPTSSSDSRRVEIGMPRQRVHRRLGAKAFAVAHIAPIGAAGYGRGVALRSRSMRGRLCTSPQWRQR